MTAKLSGAAGLAFAAVFKAIKILRPDRPIHPSGVALTGTIERRPGDTASGISWIDSPGTDQVTARLSRSLGTPPGWPDVIGLAIRITTEAGPADVLLASTLLPWPGRVLLIPHRHASRSNLTSLMPYKGASGPVLLAARTEPGNPSLPAAPDGFRKMLGGGTWTLGLYHARPTRRWIRFGTLTLALDPDTADTATRFDPLVNTLPGAGNYRWASRLREPSYSAARKPLG
ncbi:hypothetical protein QFZ79_003220 [Arthrobacter sp. V4I6]|uniref:hypothetical protein n=1 Tax=unclassified Arthrobacter TaxID=235627 RepID=UPI00278991A5|nr:MULTISPECIES: hypothetical protein [unclassified Arthrobacter]MDQ0820848.1 hypothetical protein [Arthrobacter sp. V1I7]MDQ0855109.1 hypothetical protein [Arthrobacter sp. V4I6]